MRESVLVRLLPALRRYAQAYAGGSTVGDRLVGALLRQVAAMPVEDDDERRAYEILLQRFHRLAGDIAEGADAEPGDRLADALGALAPDERAALLLTSLEGFQPPTLARILGLDEATVRAVLRRGRQRFLARAAARILIIEDEALVGLDISRIVTGMGHEVCGIAASHAEAVARARSARPDLVLADVRLRNGDDGIAAVQEILSVGEVPIIFVTGYGRDLIERQGVRPVMVLGKPFPSETLQVAVREALIQRRPLRGAATAH